MKLIINHTRCCGHPKVTNWTGYNICHEVFWKSVKEISKKLLINPTFITDSKLSSRNSIFSPYTSTYTCNLNSLDGDYKSIITDAYTASPNDTIDEWNTN